MAFNPLTYDLLMAPLEQRRLKRWRREAMARVAPPPGATGWRILDVGVGTGANFPLYPPVAAVTAIDRDPGMLGRARRLSAGRAVDLREMDVMALEFADASFDAALATLVFCEVPDPVAGLREVLRVLKPGAPLAMLEHTRCGHRALDALLSGLTAVTGPLMGEHFDRDTASNARLAGFEGVESRRLGLLVFHLITGAKPAG